MNIPESNEILIKNLNNEYKNSLYIILERAVKRKILIKHLNMETKEWEYVLNPLNTDEETSKILEVVISTHIRYEMAIAIINSRCLDSLSELIEHMLKR